MSKVANKLDNLKCQSLFSGTKCELIHLHTIEIYLRIGFASCTKMRPTCCDKCWSTIISANFVCICCSRADTDTPRRSSFQRYLLSSSRTKTGYEKGTVLHHLLRRKIGSPSTPVPHHSTEASSSGGKYKPKQSEPRGRMGLGLENVLQIHSEHFPKCWWKNSHTRWGWYLSHYLLGSVW